LNRKKEEVMTKERLIARNDGVFLRKYQSHIISQYEINFFTNGIKGKNITILLNLKENFG